MTAGDRPALRRRRRSSTGCRGVADSGYATSPYIGPLSGLSLQLRLRTADAGSFASDPARVAASKLASSLRAAGVTIGRGIGARRRRRGPTAKTIAVVHSPPMDALVNNTDVYSNNFFAEMLIKLLGAEFGGGGTHRRGRRRGRGLRPRQGHRGPRGRRLRPDPLQPRLAAAGRAPAAGDAEDADRRGLHRRPRPERPRGHGRRSACAGPPPRAAAGSRPAP